jgi:prophage antirepressor-like protein
MESAKNSQLVRLFLDSKIRVQGSVNEPLFCAADVAQHIGDTHVRRIVKDYGKKHRQMAAAADSTGRTQPTIFLTEKGLYRYLLQSRRKEAEAFQDLAYDLLAAERRRIVDVALLEAKIAKDSAAQAQDAAARAKVEAAQAQDLARQALAATRSARSAAAAAQTAEKRAHLEAKKAQAEALAGRREAKELQTELHKAQEPRLPPDNSEEETFFDYCMARLQWAHPDLEPEALLTYSETALPERTRAAIEMLRSEGRDFDAYDRFEKVALPACRARGEAAKERRQLAKDEKYWKEQAQIQAQALQRERAERAARAAAARAAAAKPAPHRPAA